MFKRYALGMAAAVALTGTSLATAAQLDDLMDIDAEILAGCTVIDAPDVLNLGSFAQGGAGTALGNILVTCGTGVDYEVAIEGGNNDAGSRRLNTFGGGTMDYIPYTIVRDNCASNTEVGTAGVTPAFGYVVTKPYLAGTVIAGSGNGAAQQVPVCAKVAGADTMSIPPGNYTDQVLVVVAF